MDQDCHRVQLIPASPTISWPQEPSSPGVPAHPAELMVLSQ